MSAFDDVLANLPEVAGPKQKRLSFKEKLKWTLTILIAYFLLGLLPLFGLGSNSLQQFEFLSLILGAEFGSLISLGIGPLVTASIVLQLLNGSGIMRMDLTTHEGKKRFQGIQKLLGIFFVLFESFIYVFMGGLAPAEAFQGTPMFFELEMILVFQLFLGGILIMFMDEIVSKWGFGSGISLFIAAGVSKSVFIRMLSPLPSPTNPEIATGAIPAFFQSLSAGDPLTAILMIAGVASTILVFMFVVYVQAMKVEIPLSFGMVRGHGIRWPLAFMYTSNIPVILVAALLANVQLWARLLQGATDVCRQTIATGGTCGLGKTIMLYMSNFFGTFVGNSPASGFILWINPQNLVGKIIRGNLVPHDLMYAFVYLLFFVVGSVIFSIFWVQTAGMDSKNQARQIMASGLQIPGFRKDQRVLERLLDRYIWPLTVMGGIAIGILAAVADLTGTLTSGTGLLLAVMIVYRLYEEIAKQHMMEMHPAMRNFMEGS